MNHFLSNQWERAKAIKRGGKTAFQSLDSENFEHRFSEEASMTDSPEDLYERRWATTLLQTVLNRLSQEESAAARGEQFKVLESCLTGDKRSVTYADLANRLGTTEAALKMAAHRLRARYTQLLKEEISVTTGHPDDLEDEVRHMLLVLSR